MRRVEHITAFVDAIWDWFPAHKRILPWRDLEITDDTQRAYQVLVSEVMLQQTQVPRVMIIYKRFLEQFPTIKKLAQASNKEVIIAWRGMGYNSRALRLRDAAKTIMEKHDGVFPQSMEELQSIKGIGHYTAAAIRNFAFTLPTPCLDTNIRRILHRTFVGPENADGTWEKDDRYLLRIASDVLEEALEGEKRLAVSGERLARDARNWHAALMDFGSLICTKRNPKWDLCPLTKKGLSKSAFRINESTNKRINVRQEPGRLVGSTFIPNRIFRGRVIDQLRDEHEGLTLEEIGARISVDWSAEEHREWMRGILEALKRDALIERKAGKFVLKE